jgi:hypothetical protein
MVGNMRMKIGELTASLHDDGAYDFTPAAGIIARHTAQRGFFNNCHDDCFTRHIKKKSTL